MIPRTRRAFAKRAFRRQIVKPVEKPIEIGAPRRLTPMLAYTAIGLAAVFGALSLPANAADVQAHASVPAFVHISCRPVAAHPDVKPGHLVNKVPPRYPEEAKKAGTEGIAILSATITKSGTLTKLKAVSGPKDLEQATLQAVRQWQYEPYLRNGKPTAVRAEITAIYSLGSSVLLPKL
jgi:TonB family protein